jgi:hypothetical protein
MMIFITLCMKVSLLIVKSVQVKKKKEKVNTALKVDMGVNLSF